MLISNLRPTVLMIQETMLEGSKAEEIIKQIIKYWEKDSIDADGHLEGLVTVWSLILQRIAVKKHDLVLETKLRYGETGIEFTILNVYGPFFDQKTYQENFSHSGAMDQENVIM